MESFYACLLRNKFNGVTPMLSVHRMGLKAHIDLLPDKCAYDSLLISIVFFQCYNQAPD